MIKINLATRKQSNLVAQTGSRGGLSFSSSKVSMPDVSSLPVRKILVAVITFGLLSYTWDSYQKDELNKVQVQVNKLDVEQSRLNAELAKTRNDDAKRKQVETDATTLRTKLDTINKLVSERQVPPKILLTLATGIPKNVWLTDIKIADTGISLRGDAVAMDDLSEFIKTLNESTYFSDFKLMSSQEVPDEQGVQIASFELSGKRK